MEIKLNNTTLCVIVRDEIENPAGGIIDFINSTVPFVEKAVIVDTGSIDGTREILQDLSKYYDNLKIIDSNFIDYSTARNISLKYARTEYVLVLDADERLTREDFKDLKSLIQKRQKPGYNFQLVNVYLDCESHSPLHNPRLFQLNSSFGVPFYINEHNRDCEHLYLYKKFPLRFDSIPLFTKDINITIKHFLLSHQLRFDKRHYWYREIVENPNVKIIPPPSLISMNWREFNPRRENYR